MFYMFVFAREYHDLLCIAGDGTRPVSRLDEFPCCPKLLLTIAFNVPTFNDEKMSQHVSTGNFHFIIYYFCFFLCPHRCCFSMFYRQTNCGVD